MIQSMLDLTYYYPSIQIRLEKTIATVRTQVLKYVLECSPGGIAHKERMIRKKI